MVRKKIKIINKLGLHARAAMKLSNLAARFASDIRIAYLDREVSAKSVMSLMVLAVSSGKSIELIVSGEDEAEAAKAVEELITNRFGEEQ